jgi:hypothetical protein
MHSLDVPEHPRKLIVFMARIRGLYPAIGTWHLARLPGISPVPNFDVDS